MLKVAQNDNIFVRGSHDLQTLGNLVASAKRLVTPYTEVNAKIIENTIIDSLLVESKVRIN